MYVQIAIVKRQSRGDFSGPEVGRTVSNIEGLEWLPKDAVLIDANDQISRGDLAKQKIYQLAHQDLWLVVDTTEWDGVWEIPSQFLAAFSSYKEADRFRRQKLLEEA